MNNYSPREYWAEVAEKFRSADASGFALVLHHGAPEWFNRTIDSLQFPAVRRALLTADARPGAKILDIGCGSGRWVRRYQELGYCATGLDATAAMLEVARAQKTSAPLICGEAHRLPFADSSFDCVSDITVVQHIPLSTQPAALTEMIRVLRPGGALILMELIRGVGLHIFPRSPEDWIYQVERCGGRLLGWFGQEFLIFDRALVSAVQSTRRHLCGRPKRHKLPLESTMQGFTAAQRVYWGVRHITVPVSASLDPVVEKLLPASLASHGVFVFRKWKPI